MLEKGIERTLAVALMLGILGAGWFVGEGFRKGRAGERYVTVKGVSERLERADHAYWYLRFSASDDDLSLAQGEVDRALAVITSFATGGGIHPDEIIPQQVDVLDLEARPYGARAQGRRFTITRTVLVRTPKIDVIEDLSRKTDELVKQGVILVNASWPTYVFSRLNDVKPEMIAEATRNARRAAEQFAADSNSRVRSIRRANQGVFQILGRESSDVISPRNQPDKKVRVVSTVQYMLDG